MINTYFFFWRKFEIRKTPGVWPVVCVGSSSAVSEVLSGNFEFIESVEVVFSNPLAFSLSGFPSSLSDFIHTGSLKILAYATC